MYRDEIENYIGRLGKSRNTCESYRRDLMQMEAFLCSNEGARVADYAELLKETKAASTVSRMYVSMNGFFRYLAETGVIECNPMEGIKAPKVIRSHRPVLDDARKSELLMSPLGYGNKAVRDRAMLGVMFDTGLKVSRLIGLRLADVKELELTETVREALDDYIYGTRAAMMAGNESDILFVNCSGRPLTRQGFWKILKGYTNGRI